MDDREYQALRLYGLECQMQRGEHLQAGGEAILREYRSLKASHGKGLRRGKRDHSEVDRAMLEHLASQPCQACGGELKQTRSGSLRARCLACDERWDFQPADTNHVDPVDQSLYCRECSVLFSHSKNDIRQDSGCGLCLLCLESINVELLEGEALERKQLWLRLNKRPSILAAPPAQPGGRAQLPGSKPEN